MNGHTEHTSVLVVGLGYRTGLAAANFLHARGSRVAVSDVKSEKDLAPITGKLARGVRVFAGNQDPSILDEGFDLLVLSPGVPQTIPLVADARRRGIPVIAEIELAYRYIRGKIIAITGTDGKSTTTTLTGHILAEMGEHAFVGGNIGIPLISLVDRTTDESVSVVELSSFQLETVEEFTPDVAAVLNVTPDHLDRYDGMESYFAAKMRIVKNQGVDDYLVYNLDDARVAASASGVNARAYSFSLSDRRADAYCEHGAVYLRTGERSERVLEASALQIMGVHNVQNAMAALLMVRAVFAKSGRAFDAARAASACASFKGLAHRMERLGDFEGRLFINDSKATTVGAVEMALRSLASQGVLILGGRTKGDDYSRLRAVLPGRVKALVFIGESADEFAEIFKGFACEKASSMDEAVARAMRLSAPGDAVLLSPACASFDWFKNFEERGDAFRVSFKKLGRGEIAWT